jgi:hypothetical protein
MFTGSDMLLCRPAASRCQRRLENPMAGRRSSHVPVSPSSLLLPTHVTISPLQSKVQSQLKLIKRAKLPGLEAWSTRATLLDRTEGHDALQRPRTWFGQILIACIVPAVLHGQRKHADAINSAMPAPWGARCSFYLPLVISIRTVIGRPRWCRLLYH